MTTLVLIETVLLAVLTVLVAGLLRAYGTVLNRLHQLDGGRPASGGGRTFELLPLAEPRVAPPAPSSPAAEPTSTDFPAADFPATDFPAAHDIAGETPTGELVSARVIDAEHDTLLLFLSSGCTSCETFWTELAVPVALPPRTRLLVVAQSARDESVSELRALAPAGVDVVLSSEAWSDYGVPGSPHVVFVDGRTGRVRGEGTGQSLRQVSDLVGRSVAPTGADPRRSGRDAEEDAVDRELLAAGIQPGDPRLYGDTTVGTAYEGARP